MFKSVCEKYIYANFVIHPADCKWCTERQNQILAERKRGEKKNVCQDISSFMEKFEFTEMS